MQKCVRGTSLYFKVIDMYGTADFWVVSGS